MATLDPPFGVLQQGKAHSLQISMLGWHTIGSCTITANSAYSFAANGNYNALGKSGTFNIVLTFTDQDPNAPSGPCTVTNAGQTLNGTYSRNGTSISFSDGTHDVIASPDPGGVSLSIAGYPKGRIVT